MRFSWRLPSEEENDHLKDEEVLQPLGNYLAKYAHLAYTWKDQTEPITANERDVKGKSMALPGVPYYKLVDFIR